MGKYYKSLRRGECLQPTAVTLLGKPLEFIHGDLSVTHQFGHGGWVFA